MVVDPRPTPARRQFPPRCQTKKTLLLKYGHRAATHTHQRQANSGATARPETVMARREADG